MNTSEEALKYLNVKQIKNRVLKIIKDHPHGLISDEIRSIYIDRYGMCRDSTVTARYAELKRKKKIEIKKDEDGNLVKRKGEARRNQWVLIPSEEQGE